MIDSILIVFDDNTNSDLALDAGFSLGHAHHAEIHVLAVSELAERWRVSLGEIVDDKTIRDYLFERRREAVRAKSKAHNWPEVDVIVRSGVSFVEVIHAALEVNADIIVQASHTEEETGLFFTSADWHLMRKSPIPVMIVKEAWPIAPSRILAAVDVLDKDAGDFDRKILALAGVLANGSGSELVVLTAWSLEGESAVRNSPWFKAEQATIDDALAAIGVRAEKRLAELEDWFKGTFPNVSTRWIASKGNARDVIPAAVEEHAADLVVVGTVGRTGIPGLMIGNTSETILSKIRRPVVTLKPDAFVSPAVLQDK